MFAKKSLGQNFLQSKGALKAIVAAGKLVPEDTVLEIGPGRGALTEALLAAGVKVIAIEKDRELIPFLFLKFKKEIKEKRLVLIEGDVLDFHMSDLWELPQVGHVGNYKLIANIPYYITGEVIRKFLEEDTQPTLMVLLVQKEVAERIMGKEKKRGRAEVKKESILSIAVKAYATPRLVVKVPRGAFVPAPNVDSAVVAFENISKDIFIKNKMSEKDFFEIVKAGFAHKRKKLGGNLKPIIDKLNKNFLETVKDKRAEELTLKDWVELILGAENTKE